MPQLSPGYIIASLETSYEKSNKLKDFIAEIGGNNVKSESLSETLGDVSRILANEAYWLEATVDDLFSIGLWGTWDAMRKEIHRSFRLSR